MRLWEQLAAVGPLALMTVAYSTMREDGMPRARCILTDSVPTMGDRFYLWETLEGWRGQDR